MDCHLQRCIWQSFCMLEMWYRMQATGLTKEEIEEIKKNMLTTK